MLLENTEAPDVTRAAPIGKETPRRRSTDALTDGLTSSMHDDVERLITIAGQLFSAIERQIHSIEQDLNYSQSERRPTKDQTVFKEQLIRTASSLHVSLNEIALHLGGQTREALGATERQLD
jgi:hypothetical protein